MDIIIASFIEEVIVPKFNYWIYVILMMIGLFAMMVALILYIMGKQVEQIQSQYNWKNLDDKTTKGE